MLFYIIGLIVALCGIINFKKGFYYFIIYKYVLVTNITLVSIPGVPLLSLDNALTILFSFLYIVNRKKIRSAKYSCPLVTPSIFLISAWLLASLFSVAGFNAELSSFVGNVLQFVMMPIMIWETVESRDDFKKLLYLLTIATLLSCLYGLIEYKLQMNPLTLYEMTLNNDTEKVIDFSYSPLTRGYRIQSFFESAIGAGVNWGVYIAFIILTTLRTKNREFWNVLTIITVALCIGCVILTRQRAGIFFVLLVLLFSMNLKKKKFYVLLVMGVLLLVVISPILNENLEIIASIFNGNNMVGSDAATRFDQISAAFELMLQRPLFGLGEKFLRVVTDPVMVHRLLGLESVWIKVTVEYGIWGIFSYLFTLIYSVFLIPLFYKSKASMILIGAYWLTYTLTSIPGLKIYFVFLVYFYFIKTSSVYLAYDGPRVNEWSINKGIIKRKKLFNLIKAKYLL